MRREWAISYLKTLTHMRRVIVRLIFVSSFFISSHLVYYRVYGAEGEENSKTTFDKSDTFLGRIDTLSVAPPCTVASLKSRIIKVEGIADPEIQLFEDTDGEVLMKDTDRALCFAERFPGCVEDDPLAVVHGPKTPSLTSMTKAIRSRVNFSE